MEREIKVAGATFVVDDPNGMMGQVDTTELKVEQAGLETARTRQQEAAPFSSQAKPNPSDPIQGIQARVGVFEAIAHGRVGPWSMFTAWLVSAMGVYPMAWGMFHAPRAAIGITFAILTVIAHTAFFFSATVSMLARRAGK